MALSTSDYIKNAWGLVWDFITGVEEGTIPSCDPRVLLSNQFFADLKKISSLHNLITTE